jgi:tRNA(fMet)-specific endonuclease VapC
MKAFDTDVLTEIWEGNAVYVKRSAAVPLHEQAVPILVAEEIVRGRLGIIRKAESGKASIGIERAYHLFHNTLLAISHVKLLPYNPQAEALFQNWRKQKIRGATHDLRIAATCIAHSTTLVSRNRRDFENIPGLLTEFWE